MTGLVHFEGKKILDGLAAQHRLGLAYARGDDRRAHRTVIARGHHVLVAASRRKGDQVSRLDIIGQLAVLKENIAGLAMEAHHAGGHLFPIAKAVDPRTS